MEKKKFNCKMEVLPVLASFLLESLNTDFELFVQYSPIFSPQFVLGVKDKQIICYQSITPTDVLRLQKVVTNKIIDQSGKLRLSLNQIEGYLQFAANDLDIAVKDFPLKNIREGISKSNVEGVLTNGRNLATCLKRNEPALLAKGMRPETIISLTAEINNIELLNTNQNVKKNERSRTKVDNIKVLNELWDDLDTIMKAGRAIFRGVDNVKLKEYTMTSLIKRVHNETSAAAKNAEAKAKETKATAVKTPDTEEKMA
jgi:hypothetical protein